MSEPSQYQVRGIALKCPHCANDTFYFREGLLNTAGMEFLDLGWLDQPSSNYICAVCGRIEWFLSKENSGSVSLSEPTECLACHATIPAGKTACPACGWTYEDFSQETR